MARSRFLNDKALGKALDKTPQVRGLRARCGLRVRGPLHQGRGVRWEGLLALGQAVGLGHDQIL